MRAPFAGVGDQVFEQAGDIGLVCIVKGAKKAQLPLGLIHSADHLRETGTIRVVITVGNVLLHGR